MQSKVVHHAGAGPGQNQQAACWQRMVQPLLQLTRQRRIHRRQVGELIQAENPAPLLQREYFQQLGPGLGNDPRFETRPEILKHLLDLQVAGALDGLAVKTITSPQPLAKHPCLAHSAPAIDDQQPALLCRGVKLAQFRFAVHKFELHAEQSAACIDVRQTLCFRSIIIGYVSLESASSFL